MMERQTLVQQNTARCLATMARYARPSGARAPAARVGMVIATPAVRAVSMLRVSQCAEAAAAIACWRRWRPSIHGPSSHRLKTPLAATASCRASASSSLLCLTPLPPTGGMWSSSAEAT